MGCLELWAPHNILLQWKQGLPLLLLPFLLALALDFPHLIEEILKTHSLPLIYQLRYVLFCFFLLFSIFIFIFFRNRINRLQALLRPFISLAFLMQMSLGLKNLKFNQIQLLLLKYLVTRPSSSMLKDMLQSLQESTIMLQTL